MHTAADVGEWRAGLGDADRERLLLGIGISHAPFIDAQPGMSWERPLATTRTYLDAMDEAGIPVDAPLRRRARPEDARAGPRPDGRRTPLPGHPRAHRRARENPR